MLLHCHNLIFGGNLMNLPNKLTLARIALVPFFVAFMLIDAIPLNYLWALVIFAIASLTDLLDGKIARKYNLITDFGKFLDPLADKVLVVSALICMVQLGWTYAWLVAVIVAREFMVSGIRLVAAGSEKKIVIAASIWGKLKTASTMAAIVIIFVIQIFAQLGIIHDIIPLWQSYMPTGTEFPISIISDVLMYICTALTVISGVQYLWQYRSVLDCGK